MPETTTPRYRIDKPTKTALLGLRNGHMASFYLFCDASASKAGLTAVRATSASSMTATEKGKGQRKEMGVSQFARGILFCKGPSQFIFVRYGGNLAKARMEYTLGVMYKRGGFDGLLMKGLRDAEVYDKADLEVPDESGVTPLQQLLGAAEAPDAPETASGVSAPDEVPSAPSGVSTRSGSAPVVVMDEPSTLSPRMSKEALLVAMEADFLNPDALEEELLEVMLEGVAPLAELLGLDVTESADLSEFADNMLTTLSGVDPEVAEALLLTEEGRAVSKMVSETLASGRPMRESGDDPITKITARVGRLLGGPLKAALDGSPPSDLDLATRPVEVGYTGKRVRLLAAKVVEDGHALAEGGTVHHVKRAHAARVADHVDALEELIQEVMDDGGETEPDDLIEELDDGYYEAMTVIDAALDGLVATPVAVIDDIALEDLEAAMDRLAEQLELRRGHHEVLRIRAETELADFHFSEIYFLGKRYDLRTSDADLSDKRLALKRGEPQPLVVPPMDLLQREMLEPVDRAADLARRDRVNPREFKAAITAAESALTAGIERLRTWSSGVLVLRTAHVTAIRTRLEAFGVANLAYQRAIGAGLPEYQDDDRLVAALMPSGDPPLALRDLWEAAAASFSETFRPLSGRREIRRFSYRLPQSPYPALVWHEGSAGEKRWTSAAQQTAAKERGYGPVITGRFMMSASKDFMLSLPGGASDLAGLKGVLAKAGYKNVYLLSPETEAATIDVVEKAYGGVMFKAPSMLGGGKLSKSDEKKVSAAIKGLRKGNGTLAQAVGMEGFPDDIKALATVGKAYAKQKGVDLETERHRDMGLEVLLDNPATCEAFIAGARASGGVENLMFYVAVTPAMARHRLLFPELTPMFGTSGVDRIQWIHHHFIQPRAAHLINVSSREREAPMRRMEAGTIRASAEAEYKETAVLVKNLFRDAMRRILAIPRTQSF
ncbi:MAG: hypothetical protein H6741_16585 [Alphaproteobacteria bacterium]|nr:hypothetical protein [Alphaproteobacteria bacterium]MCB9794333.1 hypothetical protein [Alphaproteobacteria bacterium]